MSLFTDLVQTFTGNDPETAKHQSGHLAEGLLDLLEHDKNGGIEGLRERFRRSGLGDTFASWIGTGPNQPVSPEQLNRALGPERVAALSQRAGLPPEQGAGLLARYLPEFVDKLTPEGKPPEPSQISTLGKLILGGVGAAAVAGVAAKVLGGKEDKDEKAPPATTTPASGASVPGPAAPALAPATTAPASYTVVAGDTLSGIARRLYGQADQWPRLFEANRDILQDPDRIFPGQELRVP